MIVDTNVFLHAAGGKHKRRLPSIRFLASAARGAPEISVNAEVLQEILHYYLRGGLRHKGFRVYASVLRLSAKVHEITGATLSRAVELLQERPGMSVRDALHAAVCLEAGIPLCTWDTRDFAGIPGLVLKTPRDF